MISSLDLKTISVYDFLLLTRKLGILDVFQKNWSNIKLTTLKRVIKDTEKSYTTAKNVDDLFEKIFDKHVCYKILKPV